MTVSQTPRAVLLSSPVLSVLLKIFCEALVILLQFDFTAFLNIIVLNFGGMWKVRTFL